MVIAPVHRARDPGSNPGLGENFSLKLLVSYITELILTYKTETNLQLHSVIPYRQWVPGVEVISSIKHRFQGTEDLGICMYHGLDDLSIYFARALVWLDVDVIMMYISSRHRDLEMVCS